MKANKVYEPFLHIHYTGVDAERIALTTSDTFTRFSCTDTGDVWNSVGGAWNKIVSNGVKLLIGLGSNIRDLYFGNGEQGIMLDASDLFTLFQNSTGTTPVTAAGQPVGLWLDKSKGLVKEQHPTTGWVKSSGDGVVTVVGNLITITGATTQTRVAPAVFRTMKPGLTRVTAKYTNTGGATSPLIWVAGVPYTPISGASMTVQEQSTNSIFELVEIGSGSATFLIEEYYELPGNHFSQPTAGKRPLLQTDGTHWWLQGDGVDDFMSSAAIDFTSTDKMTVWAGVSKFTGNNNAIIFETSTVYTSNNGSMALIASDGSLPNYGLKARFGSNLSTRINRPNPSTDVMVFQLDMSATTALFSEQADVRLNGTPGVVSGAGGTAGVFGDYPMYVGARGGASGFFNGHFSSLIIRGAATSEADLIPGEEWTAERIGVSLP